MDVTFSIFGGGCHAEWSVSLVRDVCRVSCRAMRSCVHSMWVLKMRGVGIRAYCFGEIVGVVV